MCHRTADVIASHGSIGHAALWAIEALPTPTYVRMSHALKLQTEGRTGHTCRGLDAWRKKTGAWLLAQASGLSACIMMSAFRTIVCINTCTYAVCTFACTWWGPEGETVVVHYCWRSGDVGRLVGISSWLRLRIFVCDKEQLMYAIIQ